MLAIIAEGESAHISQSTKDAVDAAKAKQLVQVGRQTYKGRSEENA